MARCEPIARIAAADTPTTPTVAINVSRPLALRDVDGTTAPTIGLGALLGDVVPNGSLLPSVVFTVVPVPGVTLLAGAIAEAECPGDGAFVVGSCRGAPTPDAGVAVGVGADDGACPGTVTVTVICVCAPRSSAQSGNMRITTDVSPFTNVTGTMDLSGSDFWLAPAQSVAVRPVRLMKSTVVPAGTLRLCSDGDDGHASVPRPSSGVPLNVTVVVAALAKLAPSSGAPITRPASARPT